MGGTHGHMITDKVYSQEGEKGVYKKAKDEKAKIREL